MVLETVLLPMSFVTIKDVESEWSCGIMSDPHFCDGDFHFVRDGCISFKMGKG